MRRPDGYSRESGQGKHWRRFQKAAAEEREMEPGASPTSALTKFHSTASGS